MKKMLDGRRSLGWTKMKKFNLNKIMLRKFGITIGIAFLVISSLFFIQHKHSGGMYSLVVSCAFFITGFILPALLKPIYIVWMRLAFILGWINIRVILIVMFYLIFTPVSLLMRLFGIDLLGRKNKERTYWKNKDKEAFDFLNYERRF